MSKETDLDVKASQLRDFIFQEIPDAPTWNVNVTRMREGLALIGDFFTDTDTALAELRALFEADHDVDGTNPVPSEWVADAGAPTYLGAGVFSLPGDRRADYLRGHRVRATLAPSTNVELTVALVGFDGLANRTTITVTPPALTAALTTVSRGLVRFSVPRVVAGGIMPESILGPELATNSVTGAAIAATTITPQHLVPNAAAHIHFPATRGAASTPGGVEFAYLDVAVPATRGARALLIGGCRRSLGTDEYILRLRRVSPSPAELQRTLVQGRQSVLLAAVTEGVTAARTYRLSVEGLGTALTLDDGWLHYLEFA